MADQIRINGLAVGLPAKASATIAADVVAGCFEMMEARDLSTPKPLAGQTLIVQLGMPHLASEARRDIYQTWLLSKGFHDILKGLRTSFEEAFLYIALFQKKRITGRDWDTFINGVQKKANSLPFVRLVEQVEKHLTAPLSHQSELLSLQKARNCLEHRNGVVMPIDVNGDTGELILCYPRIKVFYQREGQEIELAPWHVVEPGDERNDVDVFMKVVTYERRFALGNHIVLSSAEFIEIAMATCLIADDLVAKLPIMLEPGC